MSKVRNLDNTNLINLGYRIFTHQDQFNFAEFSNDFNPIHLDKKYARKTLPGTAIVHGLHAVLWSIELFLTKFRYMHTEYKVHFHKYIKI
jgi:acyl dehydratase